MTPKPFPLIALMGPTAVGKTELVLRLAREIHAEIINVDSVQIYRGLDIGSAKPSESEMRQVRHHLIDIREPDEPFDAADFAHAARCAIKRIQERGKAVILSGGTGLYLNALLQGLAPCSGTSPALRLMLKKLVKRFGAEYLHFLLEERDPDAAARLHPNDTFRVIRALEVVFSTGMSLSSWHNRHARQLSSIPCIKIALTRPRAELYSRIDARVDQMIAQGFIKEVESLIEQGYDPGLKPLQSLGYRHIISFLQGHADLDTTLETMKRDTRRYAKRQLTWFRGQRAIQWFNADALMKAKAIWPVIANRCAATA